MKLIPEQIKMLREKKEELLEKRRKHIAYRHDSETTQIEGLGCSSLIDYQSEAEFHQNTAELSEINKLLSSCEYVRERNFDVIDIGTAFSFSYDDGAPRERLTFVEEYGPISMYQFASSSSDFGQAVRGKKPGDNVTYTVKATGGIVSLTIDEIDRIRENYVSFIRDKHYTDRISKSYSRELRQLKENDIEEYENRFKITNSQSLLLSEELGKMPSKTSDLSIAVRKSNINRFLERGVAKLPEDGSIGIGSHVTVSILNDNGEFEHKTFEMINYAVSTELEPHYVERISPMGQALFGLHEGDKFSFKRNHKPNVHGIVTSVDNDYIMARRGLK